MRSSALAAYLVLGSALGCAGTGRSTAPAAAVADPDRPPTNTPSEDEGRLADLRAMTADVLGEVAAARQLAPTRRVDVALVDRAGVRRFVVGNLYEHVDRRTFALLGRIEASLGILPAGADPEAVILEVLEAGVLGYYDPDTDTFYVLDHVPDAMLAMVVGHELAHALQDMYFDLSNYEIPILHDSDRDGARTLLVEGDAQAAYLAYRAGKRGLDAIRSAVLDAGIDQALRLSDASPYPILSRSLQLPYAAGTATVAAVARDGGWDAVDALYRDMPTTSEQMLHPEKLATREPPIPVEVDAKPFEELSGFRRVWHDNLGEGALLAMIADVAAPDVARHAAAGWGGDRYVALEPEGGAETPLVVGGIAWDSEADAEAFEAPFRAYLSSKMPAETFVVDRSAALVRFALRLPPSLATRRAEVLDRLRRSVRIPSA
ncbi:MAG: hypothetical protein D6705_02390 [Deltaproteobacteria bacterium]|nr:MAG: hypothetical protein D6705_02390 [Deltaproteobacteria bacterium]